MGIRLRSRAADEGAPEPEFRAIAAIKQREMIGRAQALSHPNNHPWMSRIRHHLGSGPQQTGVSHFASPMAASDGWRLWIKRGLNQFSATELLRARIAKSCERCDARNTESLARCALFALV
jgi:hypothetical protein